MLEARLKLARARPMFKIRKVIAQANEVLTNDLDLGPAGGFLLRRRFNLVQGALDDIRRFSAHVLTPLCWNRGRATGDSNGPYCRSGIPAQEWDHGRARPTWRV